MLQSPVWGGGCVDEQRTRGDEEIHMEVGGKEIRNFCHIQTYKGSYSGGAHVKKIENIVIVSSRIMSALGKVVTLCKIVEPYRT